MPGLHVVTVVGARPQFIKASVVSEEFARLGVREELVHTGQHFDANMSEVFFEELGLDPPARHLGITAATHGAMTGRMLEAVEQVLLESRPDAVLVYGDTNSTLAGALAAAKLDLPLGHVEAGLRSFNRAMPEEINRVVADHVSSLLFAPTPQAVTNLRAEGIDEARILLTGDVMFDVALRFAERAATTSSVLEDLELVDTRYVLATVHRAENTDDPGRLAAIFEGLIEVSAEIPVVIPLHPRTSGALDRAGLTDDVAGHLVVVPPVGYLDMTRLLRGAALVATDSGGVQKEAYFCQVRCVTLRDETEWTELVEAGWNEVVPPVGATAVAAALDAALTAVPPADGGDLYGDGQSAGRIAAALEEAVPR